MKREDISEETFFVDRDRSGSLQWQLRQVVVDGILSRRMTAGARLPSTRALADYLGISRTTVALAYQELVADGYIHSRERSAYVIAAVSPPELRGRNDRQEARGAPVDWNAKIGHRHAGHRTLAKPRDWRRFPYPFVYGQMDETLFDHGAWRECTRQAMGLRDFADMADDVASADDPVLVDYIRTHALPRRGVAASTDEILVTLGAQNALWLIVTLMAHERFHVACENPGYPEMFNALSWIGTRVSAIDVDAEGLPPEGLPDDLDLAFVTTSHQVPTAVTMPMERREKLLQLADARDFVIIEDDYDFEMSFLAKPSPALKSLDRSGRVIYVSSFSKALFPGLRLGYLVAPAPFIEEARKLRALMLRHPPGHLQRITGYFLALGHYDRLIRRMRDAFAERHRVCVEALQREDIEISGAATFGGANFWVRGPDGLDTTELATTVRNDGVLIEPGAPFYFDDRAPVNSFRIAYSSIHASRIDKGIELIGRRLRMLSP